MPVLAALTAVTLDYYKKNKVEDLFFRESPMLYRLLGNKQVELNLVTGKDTADGGKKLIEFLEIAGSNTDTYGNTTTIPKTRNDHLTRAEFGWSGYYASDAINLDDQVQNGDSSAAMVDMIHKKLANINKTIRDSLNTGIFTLRSASTDTYGLDGLPNLFNTTTADLYGNISEDELALWSPNVIATAEAISFTVLQSIFAAASVGQTAKDRPNLCMTTLALMDAYEAKLQVQQRFIKDKQMAEAGFQHVIHKGVPISYDPIIAAGSFYALNLDKIKLKTHAKWNFKTPVWTIPDEQEPDYMMANTRWVGAMTCCDRSAHCLHTGLTV